MFEQLEIRHDIFFFDKCIPKGFVSRAKARGGQVAWIQRWREYSFFSILLAMTY
jgi:hypothetical protein